MLTEYSAQFHFAIEEFSSTAKWNLEYDPVWSVCPLLEKDIWLIKF